MLYNCISGSAVHIEYVRLRNVLMVGCKIELQSLSETRWWCRSKAVKNILNVMPVVLELLIIMSGCDDARRSSAAYGILLTLDTHFIISQCALEWVLDRIHVCSMQLQSSSGTMQSAVNAIESLAYQCDHRPVPQPDERFQEVWEQATAIIKDSTSCTAKAC